MSKCIVEQHIGDDFWSLFDRTGNWEPVFPYSRLNRELGIRNRKPIYPSFSHCTCLTVYTCSIIATAIKELHPFLIFGVFNFIPEPHWRNSITTLHKISNRLERGKSSSTLHVKIVRALMKKGREGRKGRDNGRGKRAKGLRKDGAEEERKMEAGDCREVTKLGEVCWVMSAHNFSEFGTRRQARSNNGKSNSPCDRSVPVARLSCSQTCAD
jgi:hypothetical protein